jgi:hypothetical protein
MKKAMISIVQVSLKEKYSLKKNVVVFFSVHLNRLLSKKTTRGL